MAEQYPKQEPPDPHDRIVVAVLVALTMAAALIGFGVDLAAL